MKKIFTVISNSAGENTQEKPLLKHDLNTFWTHFNFFEKVDKATLM